MNFNCEISNEEDIKYLTGLSSERREQIMRTAISIGLKSIQMSEVNMDCHSYIDPLRDIISSASEINTDKIQEIDDKLDALLHIRTNSSRKGRLSEDLCIGRLIQQYPEWSFQDVTHVGHEGDCRATSPIGEILYEFKSYDSNVNKEQIQKFYNDLRLTGVKLGIFVSNTSGIVGKKDLEWEIIGKDTLVVYISNIGFNGHGCIMATELMLALMANNILDSENQWLLHQNYETDEVYKNLIDSMDNYRSDNALLVRLQEHVKDHRTKVSSMIDSLEREVFQVSLNSQNTFTKMLGIVETIRGEKLVVGNFSLDDFLNSSQHKLSDKFIEIFIQLDKIATESGLEVKLQGSEWLFHRGDILIAKTKTMKSKILLIIVAYACPLENFDSLVEEFKDKKITIDLCAKGRIWPSVMMRLKYNE
jgi:hypothetical protein